MQAEYMQMIQNLALVLGVIFLLVYFLKKLKASKTKVEQDIKILQVLPIGNKEKIILLSVKNKKILVGVTPNNIQTLHILSESVRTDTLLDDMPVIKAENFAETLNAMS